MLKQYPTSYEGVKASRDAVPALDSPEAIEMLWKFFEEAPERRRIQHRDLSRHVQGIEEEYNPQQIVWRDRGFSGMEGSARMKQMFVEMEYWIEEMAGAK